MPTTLDRAARHSRLVAAGSLQRLLDEPDGRAILEAEANDPALDQSEKFISPEGLDHLLLLRANEHRSRTNLGFFGTDDVWIIPGFMGSALRDVSGGHGLIWISPSLFFSSANLAALKLAKFPESQVDSDSMPGVQIESPGAIPAIYDVLSADLNFRRYDATVLSYDWRRNLERPAALLADRIRNRLGQKPRPLHLIAHSQGALVARRTLQILGAEQARKLVSNLVLLGPASQGTFSAAFALAGSHESFATAQKFGVKLPDDFPAVFQSFTGLYQLLPWNPDLFPQDTLFPKKRPDGSPGFPADTTFDPEKMKLAKFWETQIDGDRLKFGFGWGGKIDTAFFNDRTSIILGGQETIGAVQFAGGRLVSFGERVPGDGTVPDFLAKLPGVQRVYRAAGVDHMTLPMHLSVLSAVRAILRGDTPSIERAKPGFAARGDDIPTLKEPTRPAAISVAPSAPPTKRPGPETPRPRREPPTPSCRRLQVFSFDPLLGTQLDTLDIARITIEVPWEPEGVLREGPVGEYVEVVDYDPASGFFYTPVDLTHPKLTAQDGLPPSESDPQFHQQMTYAVSMATIKTFEKALGRVALWAPRLVRNQDGEVIPTPIESQYVRRLRIYPHALREANAYYDPDRHALLFGYFPSRQQAGGKTMPGGTVFACQSFDIIAHETTHALLHGLHRYLLNPSNPDVLAFHEAFADVVAIFQHFSHTEVVRHQVAQTRGDLKHENLLGQLAWQFGEAMGKQRGAMRKYVTAEPDPSLIAKTDEPHDRGAILVAALFRAFQNIYAQRSRDLYRIATGGTGTLPDGDIHPDLVTRLAIEASKSARHMLNMCIRALDYIPPVDLTFGEYIRALITADFDLVHNDDRGYRVAVIDAFRSWGIYPSDVNVLDEPALLWDPPEEYARDALRGVVDSLHLEDWKPRSDRRAAFLHNEQNALIIRGWIFKNADLLHDQGRSMGVLVCGEDIPQGIARNESGRPKFEIHSVRPCLRIGPDGEQRRDIVAEIVQRRAGFFDPKVQAQVDEAKEPWAFSERDLKLPIEKGAAKTRQPLPNGTTEPDFWFRGGCTLLIDPDSGDIRYSIRKSVLNVRRLERQRQFERGGGLASTAALYFGTKGRSPFAMLHAED